MVLFAALFDRAMSDSPLLCTKAVNILNGYLGLLYHTLRLSYTSTDNELPLDNGLSSMFHSDPANMPGHLACTNGAP